MTSKPPHLPGADLFGNPPFINLQISNIESLEFDKCLFFYLLTSLIYMYLCRKTFWNFLFYSITYLYALLLTGSLQMCWIC